MIIHTRRIHCISLLFVIAVLVLPSVSPAQQPTATITQLTGSAIVTLQGQEKAAELDMVLAEGDIIETKAGPAPF